MQKLNKYKFEYDKPHEEFLDSLSKPFPAGTYDLKKLGEYLLQEDFCSKDTIDLAVEAQQTLQKRGIYKPLGKIMVESEYISPEVLKCFLYHQWADILSTADLFQEIPRQSVVKLAMIADQYVLPSDTVIFHEADQGDTFCIIISGHVRVFRLTEDGIDNTLATLGPGDGFGEIALLTGAPRSASVTTVEPTSILVIPKNEFDKVLEENSELAKTFARILANRLKAINVHLDEATETEKAFKRLVTEQSTRVEHDLVGKCKVFQKLKNGITDVSQNKQPVLIEGELGTERRSAALEIHQRSDRADTPFLIFEAETADAGAPPAGGSRHDSLQLELDQESALFGHKKGALSFAKTRRLGLLEVGNEGTLLIEGIDHLALSVQRKLVSFIRTENVYPLGSENPVHSSARIIASTTIDLAERVQAGKFDPHLYKLLASQSITVPPLRERKRDLKLIVDHFIERYSEQVGKRIKEVEPGAYQQIMTYNWPGNIDELKVVIRRAVNLSPADTLSPEHLFIGMAPVEGKITFNLLKTEPAQRLFKSSLFPVLPQIVTILFFGLLMGMGYFASQQADKNIAIILTWGFWWPTLVILWLLVARGWCAVCPLGAMSEFFSKFFSLGLKVPTFIREYGFYIAAAGLCLIIWAEITFHMVDSPMATAVLLTVLLFVNIAAGLLFRHRVWCRYLCPLGHLSGIMSRCSILEFRANTNVCNNDCPDHSCYTGNKDVNACPMMQGPFSISSNQHCILCGNCIKACPKQSPRLNLRLPAYELWNVLKADKILSIIVPLIIGTQLFRGFERSVLFHNVKDLFGPPWAGTSAAMILCLMIAILFVNTAGSIAFQKLKDASLRKRDLFVYALVPVAFSFEFAYNSKLFMVYAGQLLPVLGRQLGYNWNVFGLGIGPGIIKVLQVMCVLLGVLASQAIINSLARTHEETFLKRQPWKKRGAILLLGAVYIILFVSAVQIS